MSKIQAVRLINVNYNHNATRISDECFHLQGESTLISLRNGGGKSVMVQMLTAPFVHKRYRDTKDRTFESYFTTNKPSLILVEWALDQGAGYVLTGMMVRKAQHQDTQGEREEPLEIITLISEYREPCLTDIHHLPVVEKERANVVELLEDYIREVHRNMDQIDSNSTITVRGRSIKMLKLELPSWEEQENLYHLRLQDLIDKVTLRGLALVREHKNIQEYLGTQLTTRNLYDTVVGIGNIQIRLYKIEEQREYPITWAEVAQNSGGEGFLSAFVVLSSLLHYMRRDESDLFAERNEGKVLVMDNPFAQTNAAHLLKPLMDMAKKTNTQLICLTGLGGESIYSRFDNIYVLNLVSANLRSGMQYLKGNHLRGKEPSVLETSRLEVLEQQELVF